MKNRTVKRQTICPKLKYLAFSLMILVSPSSAEEMTTQTICNGSAPDGWTFQADAIGDQFLHLVWTGALGQNRATILTFYNENTDGYPVFRGLFQKDVEVLLVDKSGGNPGDETEAMVYSREWGWNTGKCRQLKKETAIETADSSEVRRSLLGSRDASAANWLRRNGFSLGNVVEITRTGKVERWGREQDGHVYVVFYNGIVSEVLEASP